MKRALLFILIAIFAAGCGGQAPAGAPQIVATDLPDDVALRIGVLPILDALPLYIAEEAGYFAAEGLAVEIVAAASALERDSLMQAGELDTMLTDVIATILFNRGDAPVKIGAVAFRAAEDAPQFRILAAPAAEIESPGDLAGVPVGGSANSVIAYVLDRMLADARVVTKKIVLEPVPAIPVRFEMLMSGDLRAAILPDPLAQAAIEAGAALLLDDSQYPAYSQSVISFRADFLDANPEAAAGFLRAWMRAAADLNANPEAYRALFLERANVPESVQETYTIPPFPLNQITTRAEWENAAAWLLAEGLIEGAPPYEAGVWQE
jgi:NitT/TauT family transport system substrate-binding protein